MVFPYSSEDQSIRNSISSFIKMIYFNPVCINDVCLSFLKDLLYANEKDIHNLGLFCLFSLSLFQLKIEDLRKIDAISLLVKKLETGKYEKRVYALKIIINFMEISNLDEELLKEKNFELFDFLLHFTQSELQEEQRLATRGLSKLPLQILKDRNPRVMPIPHESSKIPMLKVAAQHIVENEDRKTIREDSSESSKSMKSSQSQKSVTSKDDDLERDNDSEDKESVSDKEKDELKVPQDKHEEHSQSLVTDSINTSESSSDKSISALGSKGNIHSFISSLSLKIRPRNNSDSDIQYFSLYSIFNLLLQINIQSADKKTTEEEAKLETIPMDQKNWNDLSTKEFNMMLIQCNIVNNVIALLLKSKDEDVIRISLKIIILLTFKVPIKEFMNFEAGGSDKFWVMSCISNDSENFNYYNFQSFLGYILHRAKKEDIDITSFMTVDSINSFILKLCNDFREDELLELNSKGNNAKKKMIIYKFFFVSYLTSLLVKILEQKSALINVDVRLGVKQLCYNFIEICHSIKIADLGLSKLLQNAEESNKKREERHSIKLEGRSSIIGVIVSLCMKSLYIELMCSKKNEDNENNILDKRATNVLNNDPKEEQISSLNKKICMLILGNLTKYEDVGEIVDLTYKYLACFFENISQETKSEYTELLENSKVLVSQAVKHIAIYKCESALKFINLLIGASSKYKNKTEIENALRNLLNKQ